MSGTTGAGSYRAVLSIPNAASTFGAALSGRLSYGLLPLSLLFTVHHATDSFTVASATLAGYGGTSLLLPVKARLLDRYGLVRVLPALSAASATALAAIATLAWWGRAPAAAYLLLGVVAGLGAPPLGPAMRAAWRQLTAGTGQLQRAYSLDSVCEEALHLVGPVLVGVLLAVAPAPAALLVTAALLLAGTVAMTTRPEIRRTRPAVATRHRFAGLGPLRSPGLVPLGATILAVAVGMSIAVTCVAASAQAHGTPSAAGYIEAALAVGSVVGGLAWGRRRHTRALSTQLLGLTVLLAAGVSIASVAGNLVVLGFVLALAGLGLAPLFVVSFLAADRLAPAEHRTEASTWINTANNIGSAAGSAVAGLLVDHGSVPAGFATGGALLAATAAVVWALRHRIDRAAAAAPLDAAPAAR